MEILRRKTGEVSYPLGETDQYEDQSKNILNSIPKEELSDTDSQALIEEIRATRAESFRSLADEVLLLK